MKSDPQQGWGEGVGLTNATAQLLHDRNQAAGVCCLRSALDSHQLPLQGRQLLSTHITQQLQSPQQVSWELVLL